uniref:Uncharacterized protein n=1 Tax=Cacopsylla melanoneura TaxID=428564 RepID=A0A8D8QGN6_9HEMI
MCYRRWPGLGITSWGSRIYTLSVDIMMALCYFWTDSIGRYNNKYYSICFILHNYIIGIGIQNIIMFMQHCGDSCYQDWFRNLLKREIWVSNNTHNNIGRTY